MSHPPSQAVIEAVERALIEHFGMESCGMGSVGMDGYPIGSVWLRRDVAEIARAAEAAALRVAAARMVDLSRSTPLVPAAITARLAAIRLDYWADELTDTDDQEQPCLRPPSTRSRTSTTSKTGRTAQATGKRS